MKAWGEFGVPWNLDVNRVLSASEIEGFDAMGLQRQQVQELLAATNGDLYVFRGTRSDAEIPGGETSEVIGSTPVTIDPLRATIFALSRESRGKVPGAIYFGSKTELGMTMTKGNTPFGAPTSELLRLELELGAPVTPSVFAQMAPRRISAQDSVRILNEMGLHVQSSVNGNLSNVLRQYPAMTPVQIADYIRRANGVKN